MTVQFFCPRWGSENLPWDVFFQQARDAGYDGVEYAISGDTSSDTLDVVWNSADKQGMLMIAQHFDTATPDFGIHFETYLDWLHKIRPYQPLKINSQTGKDFFSLEQNTVLLNAAADFTELTGIAVCHETHRSKFSFAAHITKNYLDHLPSLRITFDVSHWLCVAESFLEDQQPAVWQALERSDHIHSRVGYQQGPQVPDPRLPEWQEALEKHMVWWDIIAQRHEQEGHVLTITPEFGPFPYSSQPVNNQWAINIYMMQLLKKRYHQ
jgi:hypothetical protein